MERTLHEKMEEHAIVLDKAGNQNALLFKEALLIKSHKPSLNTGFNASKDLQLS